MIPERDDNTLINIKLPWNKNVARGWGISLLLNGLLILLVTRCEYEANQIVPDIPVASIHIDALSFGNGDGTGGNKGNLSLEGEAHRGPRPLSELEDASRAALTKVSKNAALTDPTESSNLRPVKEISSDQKNNKDNSGVNAKNTGTLTGSPDGTGLGTHGSGPGLGPGIGPIDWGGGGNRVVLQKKLPKYPANTNISAQIKIRFTVAQDGTVISMIPIQRADPSLEKAAMDALRQWRFNPLKENKDMVGIISFSYVLK